MSATYDEFSKLSGFNAIEAKYKQYDHEGTCSRFTCGPCKKCFPDKYKEFDAEVRALPRPTILSVGPVLPHTIVEGYGTAYLTRCETGTNIRYEWNPNCSTEQKLKLVGKVKKYLGH